MRNCARNPRPPGALSVAALVLPNDGQGEGLGVLDRISEGLARSRDRFKEQMNVLLDRGPDLDEDFWDTLEETLILADVGGMAASDIVERLRDTARRQALPDAYAVLDLLREHIADTFTPGGEEILGGEKSLVLFVGINGTGKTTTVGKIAKEQTDVGRTVILGSADTFRAAAIEQLEVWARRADVEMVTRERGADPASVCYDTIERAEAVGADLVLIDTAGRLHTSADLMRELEKVVNVTRKRSNLPVYTVLVIDATTGQNGLQQAREFNRALHLDALIVTKLDGTAKGGIALAVSHELELPIIKIGVGESIDDLRDFDATDFAAALIGDFDDRYEEGEVPAEGGSTKIASLEDDAPREDLGGEEEADAASDELPETEEPELPDIEPEQLSEEAERQLEERIEEIADAVEDAAASADDVEPAAIEDVRAQEFETDDSEFTDEELSELAMMAAESTASQAEPEPEPEPEPKRKKHFWEKWW